MIDKIALNDICNLITDGTHDTPKTVENGYPFVTALNLKGNVLSFDNSLFVDELTHKKIIYRSKPEKGDVLMANIGASLGESAYVNIDFEFSIKNVALFKPDSKFLDGRYLYYLLISPKEQALLKNKMSGSAQPFFSLDLLRKHQINLPPLETQKKIASILSGYDDLIENNLKRIKILEEMAQQTYEEWFVRMRFPGHESATINPEMGLPEGWEKVKIEDLCTVTGGGTPSKSNEEYWIDGDINWFTPTDLTKNKSLVITDSELKTNSLGISKSSAKILQPNSFIMTSRATIGVFALLDKPFSTNQGFINITPKNENLKGYLLYNFIFRMDQLKGLATGATFPELSKSKFKVLDIIKPSDDVLNHFSEYFDLISKQLFNLTYQNQRLREARDILLPRLMMGMIEV